ncbi:MAG TPA: hypothetical protein VMQ99_16950, partial [Acetobacteraceae bacterium]|nr:hypothetical protein [Acetobacteraceae bacterium]
DVMEISRPDGASNLPPTDEQSAAHNAFRRVWSQPTDAERAVVTAWAHHVVRLFGSGKRTLQWTVG